jgi:alpha-N-arabinofuranosidase
VVYRFVATITLVGFVFVASATAQETTPLHIDVSKTGPMIDRNLFGQFAENLGNGLYGGVDPKYPRHP